MRNGGALEGRARRIFQGIFFGIFEYSSIRLEYSPITSQLGGLSQVFKGGGASQGDRQPRTPGSQLVSCFVLYSLDVKPAEHEDSPLGLASPCARQRTRAGARRSRCERVSVEGESRNGSLFALD